ncbi:MAG: protein kinase [Deltaproteobacteria bacterium]|nr:protein kinase [Deltaproteobacteria bacterium]
MPTYVELPTEIPQGMEVPLEGTHYVLIRMLGRGAHGVAYLARDRALGGRLVVIKVLLDRRTPEHVDRFLREAGLCASVRHRAIVEVFTAGMLHDGRPYYVMEWVDGESLRRVLRAGGPLTVRRALQIVADLCEGLEEAHRHDIVHRDIKPDNVVVLKGGAVKLIDFGIAKSQAPVRASDVAITVDGTVLGTPSYMSPEQVKGEPLGPAADLYSVGCVLFEMLTGRAPFAGAEYEILTQHVHTPAPSLSSIGVGPFPVELEHIVARLLAKSPAARFTSAMDVRRAALAVMQALPPDARIASEPAIDPSGPTLAIPVWSMSPASAPNTEVQGVPSAVQSRDGWSPAPPYAAAVTLDARPPRPLQAHVATLDARPARPAAPAETPTFDARPAREVEPDAPIPMPPRSSRGLLIGGAIAVVTIGVIVVSVGLNRAPRAEVQPSDSTTAAASTPEPTQAPSVATTLATFSTTADTTSAPTHTASTKPAPGPLAGPMPSGKPALFGKPIATSSATAAPSVAAPAPTPVVAVAPTAPPSAPPPPPPPPPTATTKAAPKPADTSGIDDRN